MILTTYLSQASYYTIFKHFYYFNHCSNISLKYIIRCINFTPKIIIWSCSFSFRKVFSGSVHTFLKIVNLLKINKIKGNLFRSQFIPKCNYVSKSIDLRLIIHGSKNGTVNPKIIKLLKELKKLRNSKIELEILTNNNSQKTNSKSVYLVPLFLLPGKHIRYDIPSICKRLRDQGIKVKLFPYIGSWQPIIRAVQNILDSEINIKPSLILHHPLTDSIGFDYLNNLQKKLKTPLLSWDKYEDITLINQFNPIPYCLLPNPNTRKILRSDSKTSLIEFDQFNKTLINELANL